MIAYASSRPPTKVSHQEETYIVVFSLISEASDLKRALPEFSFKITDDKVKIKSISNIAHNSIKLISLLMKSNRILYSIRDRLLPKLLTGEIKLKNQ